MSVVQNSWLSPRDYILYKIFGKPMIVENEKFLVDPTDLLLNAKDRIFRANDYPYQIDEGNHWVLWYCDIKQMFDSDTITRHIDEDIRRLVDNYMYCDEVAKVELDKQGNNIFVKQQIAYYKKNDATEKILVKVVGVHHDDFPNIYYTIQPCDPSSATFDEKQTDANRLSIVKDKDVEQPSPNPPSPSPAAVPINNNCIILNISHNKKDIPIRIDPKSTVLQLKEEISTKTGVAIKEMKLTSKGTVMKDNQVSISKSDLVHNSKIVLTKAKAR
jgi:hypothetical protein